MMENAEEEFRAMMKCQVAFGRFTVEEMRAYMDRVRDEITLELIRE